MTLLGQSLILYWLLGLGVAGAVYLTEPSAGLGRWLAVLAAVPFWPLWVPMLLNRENRSRRQRTPAPGDDLESASARAEAELLAAVTNANGPATELRAETRARFERLPGLWREQAERLRAMNQLLAGSNVADSDALAEVNEACRQSQEARRQTLECLQPLRDRTRDELLGTLAWVRELLAMLHLARFCGAPAGRAAEIVEQIASAGEGLLQLPAVFRHPSGGRTSL